MVLNVCNDAGFILEKIVLIVKIVRIAIPILLIVLVSYDFFKALTGEVNEKTKKDAISNASKRLIYAAIIFLIPTIVNIVLKQIEPISRGDSSNTTSTSWISCWNQYYNK